jgi:hypothetical protein
MKKISDFIGEYKKPFWISAGYVGLGTLSVCSVFPADTFFGSWSAVGLLLTFPVTLVSFAYRFIEPRIIYPIFIIQFIMFIIVFSALSAYIKIKKDGQR